MFAMKNHEDTSTTSGLELKLWPSPFNISLDAATQSPDFEIDLSGDEYRIKRDKKMREEYWKLVNKHE